MSASLSAGVTVEKNGSRPASSASSSSSRRQKEWKVPTLSSSYGASISVSSRSRISAAAALENVSARIASGGTPCCTSQPKRRVITRVFPVPAPATTSSGPSG